MPEEVVAPSPAEDLENLEHDLADNQKNGERLKAQIAELKKTAGEVDQKTKEFGKAADDVANQKKELDLFVKREKKMLEATVDKDAIQKLKNDALDELGGLKTKIKTAADAVVVSEKQLADAKAVTRAKQDKFDADKAIPATNADVLKDVTALQVKANSEGKANNFSKMYFLVLLMEDRLAQLTLMTAADYTKLLNEDVTALTAASNDERGAKENNDAALAAEKEAQKSFDTKKATWRQEVLDKIAAGNGGTERAGAVVDPRPPIGSGDTTSATSLTA